MKVITDYPIYIDNQLQNDADLYMSEYDKEYASFDSTNIAQLKAFQNWLDAKYPTWFNGGKLNKDESKGYGKYNEITKSADSKYGKEFDEAIKQFIPTATAITTSAANVFTGGLPKVDKSIESGSKKDEDKKIKTRNIIIISSIGVLALGIIIYLVTRKK